jgi:hypothetical protein
MKASTIPARKVLAAKRGVSRFTKLANHFSPFSGTFLAVNNRQQKGDRSRICQGKTAEGRVVRDRKKARRH